MAAPKGELTRATLPRDPSAASARRSPRGRTQRPCSAITGPRHVASLLGRKPVTSSKPARAKSCCAQKSFVFPLGPLVSSHSHKKRLLLVRSEKAEEHSRQGEDLFCESGGIHHHRDAYLIVYGFNSRSRREVSAKHRLCSPDTSVGGGRTLPTRLHIPRKIRSGGIHG